MLKVYSFHPSMRLVSLQGDRDRGRQIFFRAESSQCFQCHRVDGEGRNVGPDLSRIGQKYGRRELYESIINPSAAIGHEYQPWVLRTADQGYLIGFIWRGDRYGDRVGRFGWASHNRLEVQARSATSESDVPDAQRSCVGNDRPGTGRRRSLPLREKVSQPLPL